MDLYNSQKVEGNVSVMFSKPLSKEMPSYNNYFEPKITKEKTKKQDKENMKNNSRIGRDKDKDDMSRSNQTQTSFIGSTNKRVSSAKSRQEKKEKKVVYDRVSSKKSLKNEEYGSNNREIERVEEMM